MTDPKDREAQRPPAASLAQVARAVLWSLFGVRKRRDLDADAERIRPHQVVLVAFVIVALLVALLVAAVRAIVRGAG